MEVGSLTTARNLIRHDTGLPLPTIKFKGRERFLVPSSLTHGLLIEMVE